MDNREAVNWLINISEDIGKAEHSDLWHYEQSLTEIKDMLESAQPEPKWIPVSEKLPEERDWYLGIFKEPDTGWINPIPFICDYLLGTKTKATTKEGWILKGHTDREEYIDYYFNLECVAWCELPEPYKGGGAG